MFTCHSVTEGRFVAVHFPSEKTAPPSLCEVEVFADTGIWDFHQKTTFGSMCVTMSFQYCHN